MDISVFNLLMSTTPNVGTDSSVDAAIQSARAQETMRTGDAFLKVLDQVRNGVTEKTSETLFNTMSARADASSSLKDLKVADKGNNDVKVLKLSIKRTRHSEKMRQQETNAAKAQAPVDNRQKIPTQENTAVVSQNTTDTNAVATEIKSDEMVFDKAPVKTESVENQTVKPVADEELTAADILVGLAVQAQIAPVVQVKADTTPAVEAPVFEAKTEVETPVIDETTEETPVFEQARPVDVKSDTKVSLPVADTAKDSELPEATDFAQLLTPVKAETVVVNTPKAEEKPVAETVVTQKNTTETTDETVIVNAPKSEDKQAVKTVEAKPVAETRDDTDTTDIDVVDMKELSPAHKQAHRQAAHLAARLPADTNIKITVENNLPVQNVQATTAEDHKSRAHKVAAKAQSEETLVTAALNDGVIVKETADIKTLSKADDFKNSKADDAESAVVTDNADDVVILPVEQKATPATTTRLVDTEIAAVRVDAAANETNGQPAFVAHQETKAKAAATSSVPVKHTPVNELVDQIKVNISKALKAGLDKIDVVLKTKELGTIKVHLEIDKDGNMKATLSSARADTLDLLKADLSSLKQAMTENGFNMNDESFAFNYRGERFNENEHNRHAAPNHADDADENEEITTVSAAAGATNSGRYALNIKV